MSTSVTLRSGGFALLALAGGLLLSQSVTRAAPPAEARPLKIAVVDIGLLFKKYVRKDTFEKSLNAQRERLKNELQQEKKKLDKLKREFDKLPFRRGSEPWLRAREQVKVAQMRLELMGDRMQRGLKNEVEHNTIQILDELESTIANWGKREGYDLILKIDKTKRGDDEDSGDLVAHFQERIFRAQISDILYYDVAKLDVTAPVLAYLNQPANLKYQAERAKKKKD